MERREVPGTGIRVSPICLGTMTFGKPVAKSEAIKLVHWAMDQGVNFIDTANIYEGYDRSPGSAGGVAEEILGEALAGRRDGVVLITKVGNPVGQGSGEAGLGTAHVRREIDRSLRRLRTDRVDFYLAHRPDPSVPLEAIADCFDALIQAGKIRHWGFSNFEAADVRRLGAIAAQRGLQPPRLSQPHYNPLRRENERDHLPACRELGIGVTCYRPLEGGLLSGKYAVGEPPPAGTRASEMPAWLALEKQDAAVFRKIAAITAKAGWLGVSTARYSLAWVIAQAGVTAAVVGVKNKAQAREAIAAAEWVPPVADWQQWEECPRT